MTLSKRKQIATAKKKHHIYKCTRNNTWYLYGATHWNWEHLHTNERFVMKLNARTLT